MGMLHPSIVQGKGRLSKTAFLRDLPTVLGKGGPLQTLLKNV